MSKCCICGKDFKGYGDECPVCKNEFDDMAPGDNGR